MSAGSIVSKVWNFATLLRDDGMSYGDYLEQLTYLLFLKMADERASLVDIPAGYGWADLRKRSGSELEQHYVETLRKLSKAPGMLGQIFVKSRNQIQEPSRLFKLIRMIDEVKWTAMGTEKGDVYEGLLEKNAQDVKSGAGQYFTPRPLIQTIVECVRPRPGQTVIDPACGTGGFFLAVNDYLIHSKHVHLNRDDTRFLRKETFFGNEIVANTRRLCLMNLYLHGIGTLAGEVNIQAADALISEPSKTYDIVLANPPFGKKSKMTFTNEDGEQSEQDLVYNRQDFYTRTSNKQLNFLQHIKSLLKNTGRAAVVLPDNVLFEGGAGEVVRKSILQGTELHTILRLPTGIFYAPGVKANVLFFDNHPASPNALTKDIWVYDYRTNVHHTLKKLPMRRSDLAHFVECYNPSNRNARTETWSPENPDGRWRKYTYEEVIQRDKTNLDIFWLKDQSLTDLDNLPDPDVLAEEIIEHVESALAGFREMVEGLD